MTAEEYLAMTVPQTFLAKVLGVTQGRISQLLAEGIIGRDEESGRPRFHESIKNYYLSKNASGAGVNFWTEKALLERAKREMAELKLAQRKGELYIASEVEQELAEWLVEFRTKLLGLGHRLARQLEGKNATAICEIIDAEITDCLEELSSNVEDAEYKNGALDSDDD